MNFHKEIELEEEVVSAFQAAVGETAEEGYLDESLAFKFMQVVRTYLPGTNFNTLFGTSSSYNIPVTDDLKIRTDAAIAMVKAAHEARKVMLPLPTSALTA